MKVTLEFTLPEEAAECRCAIDGSEWKAVVSEFDQWLRGKLKHEGKQPTAQEIRDELWRELNDRYLALYD